MRLRDDLCGTRMDYPWVFFVAVDRLQGVFYYRLYLHKENSAIPSNLSKEKNNMSLFTLFVTAVGLSMDAFAVSVCKGLAMKKLSMKKAIIIGLWFGGFQALMPTIGYLLGTRFEQYVTAIDHWIAFVLLALIGANMIKEALSKEEDEANDSVDVKTMFLLAVATSIDALAVGVTYAFLQVQIIPAVAFIGVITFSLSVAGVKIGNVFGLRYKSKAEITGGVILILMGAKILLEHLGLLNWI